MKEIFSKNIEIFCGTGGVGKTTLATSRALFQASTGRKTLLITIDPAKRLKQILNLEDNDKGSISSIPNKKFEGFEDNDNHFDALLLSPASTLENIGFKGSTDSQKNENPIFKILTKPHGGMNEIMAVLELQHHLNSGLYDTVILDTPPGKHFIDFLYAANKIKHFFDKSFIDIFQFLGKPLKNQKVKKILLGKVIQSGVKKLLSYLEKVTGEEFVHTFVDAVLILYNHKDNFLEALNFQHTLTSKNNSNWFLVTSAEQGKINEAEEFRQKAINFMHEDNFLCVNKCLEDRLKTWNPPKNSPEEIVKINMLQRETSLKNFAALHFDQLLEFPEVIYHSPSLHVAKLAHSWLKWSAK